MTETVLLVVPLFELSSFLEFESEGAKVTDTDNMFFGKTVVITGTFEKYTRDELTEKLQEVQDENNYLTDQKAKLQDPDYVESFARGNYMLSRDGEQIFYLPEKENK